MASAKALLSKPAAASLRNDPVPPQAEPAQSPVDLLGLTALLKQ
eukprot:SAG11_NODE_640_length_8012_cov_14.412486_3_plen_44_part_00